MTNANMWKLPIFLLLITALFTLTHSWVHETHKKIQLKDLKVLTLHQGQMTKGRRVNSVPQLNCIGGDAKFYNNLKPQLVQCTNKGWDGQDYQWECKAEMSDNVRFGMIDVSCEGYDYPNDDYVLAGSCGLNYNLELTERGKMDAIKESWSSVSYFIFLVVILIILMSLGSCCSNDHSYSRYPRHSFWYRSSSYRSRGGTSRMTSGFGGTSRR